MPCGTRSPGEAAPQGEEGMSRAAILPLPDAPSRGGGRGGST